MKTPLTPWNRIVLFWHYGLSCPTRALLAVTAFALLWLAGALRLLGLRRLAKAITIPALLVLVILGSSVLTTLEQESNLSRPISLRAQM